MHSILYVIYIYIRDGVPYNTYYKLDWSYEPHTQCRINLRCKGLVNIYIYIYAQAKLMKTIEKPKKTKKIKGAGPK